MYTPDEAVAMIEAGEHVVEVAVTYMDGVFESYYPSKRGWNSSTRDPDLYSAVLLKFENGYLQIPMQNVRYYEVIVHNPPPRKEPEPEDKVDVLVLGPDGEWYRLCENGGIPHLHPKDEEGHSPILKAGGYL
jgi:hypothetical protein